jgi:hypothetical protein
MFAPSLLKGGQLNLKSTQRDEDNYQKDDFQEILENNESSNILVTGLLHLCS